VLADRYGSAGGDGRDYQLVDEVAVIGVQGVLLKKGSWLSAMSGCTSYQSLQQQIEAAIGDDRVGAILLDIDSPGGETCGCFELSDFIYGIRGEEPIYAVANDTALSAAYAIASAADKIFVTRMGAVGSVGVYALHAEQSGFDKQTGMKYTYIHHGAKKVDGNPHEPLSDGATADLQAEIDRQGRVFIETVARNRGVGSGRIEATQAGLLWGDGALTLFADEIGTVEDALNQLRAMNPVLKPKENGARGERVAMPQTIKGSVVQNSEPRAVVRKERETMITHSNGKTAAAAMQNLEREAAVFARQNHITKEQAVAQALEDNPEVYAAYRANHNAAPLVAQLEAAGIKFRE